MPSKVQRSQFFMPVALLLAGLTVCAAHAQDTPRLPTVDVELELIDKAPTPTLQQIDPYTDALAVYRYKVVRVRGGELKATEIAVTHWVLFRKQEQPVTRTAPGKKVRLRLTAHANVADQLQTVYRSELDEALDLPLFHDVDSKIQPPDGEKTRWNYGVDVSEMMPVLFELKDQVRLVALGDCQAWFANKAQNYWTEENLKTPVALNLCQQRSGLPFQKLMIDNYLVKLPKLEWVVLTWNPRFVSAAWTEHGIKARQFAESPGFKHDQEHTATLWKPTDRKDLVTVDAIQSDPRFLRTWQNRPWGWVYLAPNRHRFNPRGEVLKVQKKLGAYKFVPDRWEIFEDIVKTLAEHDIKLLVYTTPIHPETANQKVKDKMGFDEPGHIDQLRRMNELAARYPKTLFFHDLNNLGDNGLEDADFENIDHVSASGAEKVSRRVEAFRREVEARLSAEAKE